MSVEICENIYIYVFDTSAGILTFVCLIKCIGEMARVKVLDLIE